MNITIYPTDKIIQLTGAEEQKGVPARIWEGLTDSGIKVQAFLTRIAIGADEPPAVQEQFRKELQETQPPSAPVAAYPLRLVL